MISINFALLPGNFSPKRGRLRLRKLALKMFIFNHKEITRFYNIQTNSLYVKIFEDIEIDEDKKYLTRFVGW